MGEVYRAFDVQREAALGGPRRLLVGDEVAHHPQRDRHQRPGPHPHRPGDRQWPQQGEQPREPPCDREGLAVVAAQDRGPTGAEVPLVGQQLRDEPAGLKAVVDALAVERRPRRGPRMRG
jgi:hypothetical protein